MNQPHCKHNQFLEKNQCPCMTENNEWVYPDNVFVDVENQTSDVNKIGWGFVNQLCKAKKKNEDYRLDLLRKLLKNQDYGCQDEEILDQSDHLENKEEDHLLTISKCHKTLLQHKITNDIPTGFSAQLGLIKEKNDMTTQDLLDQKSSLSHSYKEPGARRDVKLKTSVRQMRRFYRDIFKSKNRLLVRKRYVNCSIAEVIKGFRSCLANIVPTDLITQDLIYFGIGITGIKKSETLRCRKEIKQEIKNFLQLTRRFSERRLRNLVKSCNIKTLLRYFILNKDTPESRRLKEFMNSFE
ncbi:unnamed protein product [Moneuplotes crassus]|uniref:Uncharacterized protein n=1 Tax=Euplotes crassus TaxID=5936 RepID=A0AAD1Y8W1_EUPCR|nr:unnamed protein product [Moneuplotes crassus]